MSQCMQRAIIPFSMLALLLLASNAYSDSIHQTTLEEPVTLGVAIEFVLEDSEYQLNNTDALSTLVQGTYTANTLLGLVRALAEPLGYEVTEEGDTVYLQ